MTPLKWEHSVSTLNLRYLQNCILNETCVTVQLFRCITISRGLQLKLWATPTLVAHHPNLAPTEVSGQTTIIQGRGPISWPTPSGTMYLWTSVLSRHRLFAAAYDLPYCSCLTWKVLVGIPAPVWYVSVWGFSTLLNLKDTSAAPRRWPSTSACYQNTFQVLAHQDMNLEPSTSQQMLQTQ